MTFCRIQLNENVFFRVQAKVNELYTIDVLFIDIDVVKLKIYRSNPLWN